MFANRENRLHARTPRELDAEFGQLLNEQSDVKDAIEGLDTLDGKLALRDELLDSAESYIVLVEQARGPERRQLREKLDVLLADVRRLNEEIEPLFEAERRDAAKWRRYMTSDGRDDDLCP